MKGLIEGEQPDHRDVNAERRKDHVRGLRVAQIERHGLGGGRLFGRRLRPLQTGRAQSYAFATFAGLFVLIILIRYIWRT